MWKFLARRGAVGGTARWVAKFFITFLPTMDIDNLQQNENGHSEELQKIVEKILDVRSGVMPLQEVLEIQQTYEELGPGMVNFTIAILAVEAGFFSADVKNQKMFEDVIREELIKKGIGHRML